MTVNDKSVGTAEVDRANVVVARSPWRTTLVASLGLLAAYVPVTAVITALPSIQRGLSTSASSLQWVSDALVIPMAALILSAGVFGDVHGRRKVFLAGLMATAATPPCSSECAPEASSPENVPQSNLCQRR